MLTAADCLEAGANALDNYADGLRWAQRQAGEAIHLWNQAEHATQQAKQRHEQAVTEAAAHNQPPPPFSDPGADDRQAARDTLARARTQLDEAGDIATGILRGETRPAPEESSWFEEGAEEVGDAGAAVINGVASFGNAATNNPGAVLAGLGGVTLTAVSATGELAGVTLDATGVGAVAGVPLNVASTAGMATGIGITTAAMAEISSDAAGADHVEVVEPSNEALDEVAATEEASPAEAPKEITGFTEHGEQQALTRDGGRGVNEAALYDAVENPVEPPAEQSGPKGPTYRYEGQDATVVLNGAGKVVTTWANTSEGLRNSG